MCWSKHGYPVEDCCDARFDAGSARDERGRRRGAGAVPGRSSAGGTVDRRLAIDLDLFSRGGLKILEKIERQDYDVLRARPAISKVERVGLLLGAITRRAFRGRAA